MNWKNLFKTKTTINELPVEYDWDMVSRSYSPPRKDVSILSSLDLSEKVLQMVLTGATTYLWQCRNTGELRKETILGNDKDELEELVDKVEKGGMQYIRMNGSVYAITKWVPQKHEMPEMVSVK